MPRYCLAIALAVLASTFPTRSEAQDISRLLGTAENLVQRNEFARAQEVLRDAMMAVSNQAPLEIDFFDLVTVPAENYSNVHLREDNVFKRDEPMLLYVEPVGYAFERIGDKLRFGVEADFVLLDESGTVLGGKDKFHRLSFEGHAPVFDFYMNLTYNFTGLAPGRYAVRTTLTDLVDGEQAWFEMPFEIRN